MIIGFVVPKDVLDETVPTSFMEGIEEPYTVTFRDYAHCFIRDDLDDLVVLEIAKRIGNNGYSTATNRQAWLDYFSEECAINDEE